MSTNHTTLVGTVSTGFGAVWELHRNGKATWATDQYGVILTPDDGLAVGALIDEYRRISE